MRMKYSSCVNSAVGCCWPYLGAGRRFGCVEFGLRGFGACFVPVLF